jgi:hypothetical protein
MYVNNTLVAHMQEPFDADAKAQRSAGAQHGIFEQVQSMVP